MFIRESFIRRYAFLLTDLICIIISVLFANYIRFGMLKLHDYDNLYITTMLIGMFACVSGYFLLQFDKKLFERGLFRELIVVLKLYVCIAIFMFGYLFFTQRAGDYSRLQMGYFSIAFILLDYLARIFLKQMIVRAMRNSSARKRILLISSSDKVETVLDQFEKHNNWYFLLTGIVLIDADKKGGTIKDIPVIANMADMMDVCKEIALDGVFINISPRAKAGADIRSILHAFQGMGVAVHVNIDELELDMSDKVIENLGFFKVVSYVNKLRDPVQVVLKRIMDIVGAIVGLLITAVLSVFVIPAIMLESPGNPFFSQIRVGRNGRHFRIYKFRSMYLDADARKKELMDRNEMKGSMFKIENDPRVTKVGRFLRKHSIDELPQFWNVLTGDMSLVGTRPPTVDEVETYRVEHKRRLSVTPGLTGFWQTSGRSDVYDFEEVVKLDLQYIDQWSLLLDVKLILKTIGIVFTGRGAS